MLETLICVQRKLSAVLRRERDLLKQHKLLQIARDKSGVEQFLHQGVEELEYGYDRRKDSRVQKKIIDRVIGKSYTVVDPNVIVKSLENFEDWTRRNLSNKSLKFMDDLSQRSVFDTNFNAIQLATRRIERSLFLKLRNN